MVLQKAKFINSIKTVGNKLLRKRLINNKKGVSNNYFSGIEFLGKFRSANII